MLRALMAVISRDVQSLNLLTSDELPLAFNQVSIVDLERSLAFKLVSVIEFNLLLAFNHIDVYILAGSASLSKNCC